MAACPGAAAVTYARKKKMRRPARETDARKNREKDDIGSARKRLLDIFAWWDKKNELIFTSSFLVGEGGFACLRAGRSAALMRRRRIIHFRSPSNPPDEKKNRHT